MAYNNDNAQAFRSDYRAAIHPLYNPWLHAAFVLAYGLLCIGWLWSTLEAVAPWQWPLVPATLVFFSWGEYQVHKRLGHNKTRFGKLFYKRHTGDHHSFFVETLMPYETTRDWRVILFPAWLIVLFSLPTFAVWWLLSQLDGNLAALFAGSMLLGYMSYEVVHACEHLPAEHPVSRLPLIRQMRRLHALHHRRGLMHSRNFGIVHPLMDWLYGTLHWEPEAIHEQNRQQHRIRIAQPAEQVLDYAAAPSHWPQWHPSSLRIYGREGALLAGERFEEDIHAGGRAGHLRWDVLDYQPAQRWQASARGDHGLQLLLTYECVAMEGGCEFVRTLEYGFDNLLMRLANGLFMRRRIERESQASMRALHDVLART
ncbi:sterol desaturase [Ectopseudomonas composti]|uniref:Sterol desaturase n=1 Tax=Ectopseudomonas composti TaxID=658457 RepID=A0ABP3BR31_9GAMM|nr:SRPBCC family protein [Pseudomonas composti]EZH77663.1 sterol desaturase [Pseudomonas composti]